MNKKSKEQLYRITIGFPLSMAEAISDLAKSDDRSFNWMVISMLQTHLEQATKKGVICGDAQER